MHRTSLRISPPPLERCETKYTQFKSGPTPGRCHTFWNGIPLLSIAAPVPLTKTSNAMRFPFRRPSEFSTVPLTFRLLSPLPCTVTGVRTKLDVGPACIKPHQTKIQHIDFLLLRATPPERRPEKGPTPTSITASGFWRHAAKPINYGFIVARNSPSRSHNRIHWLQARVFLRFLQAERTFTRSRRVQLRLSCVNKPRSLPSAASNPATRPKPDPYDSRCSSSLSPSAAFSSPFRPDRWRQRRSMVAQESNPRSQLFL